jgi:septal ring factor EnvC (AmiA/AmiB activator)
MLDHIEQLVAANKSMIKELKTCRMAQAVMDNTVAELEKENTRLSGLMSERGQMLRRYDQMVVDGAKREEAWKAKLAKAVEALRYYAAEAMPWEADDSLIARTTLAEIENSEAVTLGEKG